MIIDSHLHLRDDRYVGEGGSPENIVRLMDQAGIDKSVVFKIWTDTEDSVEAGKEAARFSERLIPYAYAVPSYERPVLSDLEDALSEKGFYGIKIHAGDCKLEEYIIDPVLELAGKYGVPCLIDYGGDHSAAERVARDFAEVKTIVAHLGKYLCRDEQVIDRFVAIAEEYDNVWLDVSGVVRPSDIGTTVKRVGSNRVIWGTDGPQAPDPVAFVEVELDKIRALNLDQQEERDVLGGTMADLLEP